MGEVRDTLNERGGRYGRFDRHAGLADQLIRVAQFKHSDLANLGSERYGWLRLAPDQRHAIRYILDKIARVLEGDPDYTDNWHDMAGYATLIEDRLNGTGLYTKEQRDAVACTCGGVGNVHKPDCALVKTARPTG